MSKILFLDYTSGEFWLSGEVVAKMKGKKFEFEADGKKFSGEIKTIGEKHKSISGYEEDQNMKLKDVFEGLNLIDYLGYEAEIPDITWGELNEEVPNLVRNVPAINWTKEQRVMYDLYSIAHTSAFEFVQKRITKPVYKEDKYYINYDCPLWVDGKGPVQPTSITTGNCSFNADPQTSEEQIIIAWDIPEGKKRHNRRFYGRMVRER